MFFVALSAIFFHFFIKATLPSLFYLPIAYGQLAACLAGFAPADGIGQLPNLRGAALDARGNGQSIAEAMRDEFGAEVCESVMLSENWYRTHTAPFKAALEDGTLDAIPKDEDILTDLRAFELVRGVPRIPDVRTKGQDGKKRHGDAAIAFVLAHYASRELNTGPIRVASRRIRRKSALTKGY